MPRIIRSIAALAGVCLALLCLEAPSALAAPAASSAPTLTDRPASTSAAASTNNVASDTGETDRRGCVTRREFRRAKKGMKRHRIVHRIFHARGERNPYVPKNRNIWGYSACKCGYFVEVDYTNLRHGKPYRMVRKGWYPQEGGCMAKPVAVR